MLTHINDFFTTFVGQPLPQPITLALVFSVAMWLFKVIFSVFGVTKTKLFDRITLMGCAYILLEALTGTINLTLGA